MLVILALFAVLGALAAGTGIHPMLVLALFGFAVVFGLYRLVKVAAPSQPDIHPAHRCIAIRANGTQCTKERRGEAQYCDHHARHTVAPPAPPPTPVKVKRSQCGAIKDDGSKCKKLKPADVKFCNYHQRQVDSGPS
jgi:hypothetical protein